MTPPDQAAQAVDKILLSLYPGLASMGEDYAEAKADLLALMYEETLDLIGSDEVAINAGKYAEHDAVIRDDLRAEMRQTAAKRYGQIRGER